MELFSIYKITNIRSLTMLKRCVNWLFEYLLDLIFSLMLIFFLFDLEQWQRD